MIMSADNKSKGGGIITWAMHNNQIVLFIVSCLCLYGIFGLSKMRKNEFPELTVRQGVVVAVCPGYTASEIEERVIKPLENYIFQYKEVNKSKTKSMSRNGIGYVQMHLSDELKNKDEFWSKFKHGIAEFKPQLPQNVLALKVMDDFGDTSAMLIAVESDQKTYHELWDYIDNLENRLRTIPSIGRMTVHGMQNEQISIKIDHARLSQYALTEKALIAKLAGSGILTSGGNLKNGEYESPIHVSSSTNTINDISETIILSTPDGSSLRLKDVAEVEREYPAPTSYIRNNGRKCLLLSVEMKPGYNMVKLGEDVNEQMKEFERTLPDDITMYRITDQSKVVGDSVNNFLHELMIAIVAVILVVLMLLPMRVALISAMTIPITIFISLALFHIFGMELNTVTLAALIVMLGMIVDDSIVIIDNYMEQLSEGVMDRRKAAVDSARHFFVNIIFATLAISVTFFPILVTNTGTNYEFLKSFPWAVSIILIVSLLVAVMLVPFLQYCIIRKPMKNLTESKKEDGKMGFSFIIWLQRNYNRILKWCFRHPRITIAAAIIGIILGIYFMKLIPRRMLPNAERDQFAVEIYLPTGSNLDMTAQMADSLEQILRADDRVVSVTSFIGCASPRFHNMYAPQFASKEYAQFIVNTIDHNATEELLNEYTPLYSEYFPEAIIRFKQIGYSDATSPIEVRLSGLDRDSLIAAAQEVEEILRSDSRIWLVRSDLNEPLYISDVNLDRYESARLGISNIPLELSLSSRYGGSILLTSIWEGDYNVPVVLKSATTDSSTVSSLLNEQIDAGLTSVSLRQFADLNASWDYGQLGRRNGMPTITVSAETGRGLNAIKLTQDNMDSLTGISLPEGVTMSFGGEYEEQQEKMPSMLAGLSYAIFIIFLILLVHYKKLSKAFFLLCCLSMCLLGATLGMMLHNIQFGTTCVLGIIALMGIIVRNAIIMVDYAHELQDEGYTVVEAIYNSARRRMRPIFLTSAAASMGVIPMILSRSGLWMPMGVVIFYGTLITMLFILLVIPVGYMLLFHGKEDYKRECENLE